MAGASLMSEAIGLHKKSNPTTVVYGTSGIRGKAATLDSILFRMGMLAVIRSRSVDGKAIGLMITASHNPVDDNGFKMIDFTGGMLDHSWEGVCTSIANESDANLEESIRQCENKYSSLQNKSGLVFVARDTRPSSESLSAAAISGIKALGGEYHDYGLLTTPQLHFIIREYNLENKNDASEDGYYKKFGQAFIDFCLLLENRNFNRYQPRLHLDCANGVGGPKMSLFLKNIASTLAIDLHNSGDGVVNHDCGSSYVEKTRHDPISCSVKVGEKWASFDGDADRIVYYYRKSDSNELTILDGDKLAALFCLYVKELLESSSLDSQLTLQVIQTAYSNGNGTKFLKERVKVHVECTATGVKYLMRKAPNCDISIFFEANGHGSIIYNEKARKIVDQAAESGNRAALKLSKLFNIANLATGDAISDLLITEAILQAKDWSLNDWDTIYDTIPARLLQTQVPDRNFIKTNDIATIVLEPHGLQQEISRLILQTSQSGRVTVRPSGTEDIVRVYAEAETQEKADQLARAVVSLVEKYSQIRE